MRAGRVRRCGSLRSGAHRRERGRGTVRDTGDTRFRRPFCAACPGCALRARMRLRAGRRGAAVRRRVPAPESPPPSSLPPPATLVASAPGGPMPADEQCAPTEIVLYVRRESSTNEKPANGPPPPLAEPLIDLNIQPGQARGYEVRAGQLIQVVDVKGRECTDFQAFSLRSLDRGMEREIDPTTTRTLMGLALSGARALLEVLHRRSGAAARARPGHVRAPRLVRPRLRRTLLRGHGIPRACELLGQHQRRRRAVRHPSARRMARHQLLLQHHAR